MSTSLTTALVIGASRGLGRGLVDALARRGVDVTGTVRQASQIESTVSGAEGHVTWLQFDINERQHMHAFLSNLPHPYFDLVFIVAGVSGPQHQSVEHLTNTEFLDLFHTNTLSPIFLAEQLVSRVTPQTGVLALMTSRMGSVGLNTTGGMQFYRASKAALNSLTRSFAADLAAQPAAQNPNITLLSVHPGWVATELGGEQAPLDIATSVQGMLDTIDARRGSGGHAFVDYQNQELVW